MPKWKLLFALLVMIALAACQGNTPPPPNAQASTPIADLPVSNASERERALPSPVPEDIIAEADAEYTLLTNIYERSAPAVVNIEVVVPVTGVANMRDLGRGSGFVYDRNGHIVTNAHVINMAREIRVTFDDGFVTTAELVGQDNYSDLAVIKVDVPITRLQPLELADSDALRVGQRAIAIGNPFGLSSSMTVGIISGLGRQLSSAALIDSTAISGFQNPRIIQVDAEINPGNSGGPLLDSWGQVIGVNTAIRSESGVFQGVGFSVPSNTVRRVVPELIDQGQVDYSWIGITTAPSDYSVASLAEALGLPVSEGVLVTGVTPNSPADKAGLLGGDRLRTVREIDVCAGGDIIVAVDGEYVRNMDEMVAYLVTRTHPGDTVTLLVIRDGETFDVPVTLESRPSSGDIVPLGCGR